MSDTPYSRLLRGLLPFPEVPTVRRTKDVAFCDVETYRNIFYVAFKRQRDGRRIGFEFSDRSDLDRKRVRNILRKNTIVTFNGMTYDAPIIFLALSGASNEELKRASDRIIRGGIKWWDVQDEIGIRIPKWLDHIDLSEPNPAVMQSLKMLNGRLHGRRLQDLPFDPDAVLTHAEMDELIDYCLVSDLDATENLFNALREPLELRVELGKEFNADFRSKSDAQFGEYIIKHRIQKKTGKRPEKSKFKPGISFKYNIPKFIRFDDPVLNDLLDKLRNVHFHTKKDGKTEKPKNFGDIDLVLGSTRYSFGIGGLHSTEANRSVHSDEEYILIDADVASQYPRAISKLKLYPPSVGPVFNVVYDEIIDDRVRAKHAGLQVRNTGLKIALNGGGYGKLGSRFSVLYAPHLLLAVTLTCQLSVLMLIEKAEALGVSVVSGNTDGVVFRCPRRLFNGFVMKDGKPSYRMMPSPLQDVIEQWEAATGFDLEFTEYRSIYNQSVNTYMAIKGDGSFKRKGAIANHWRPELPWGEKNSDYDPSREGLKKNPQMTICADAALGMILHRIPVEKTIRGCRDVRDFVTVTNAAGGATWRDGYLGKVVRYIWSTDGDPIVKVTPHATTGNRPKVSKSDGCRPLMTLPDEFPPDIDYDRYVEEANKILKEIGFVDRASGDPISDFL